MEIIGERVKEWAGGTLRGREPFSSGEGNHRWAELNLKEA